MSREGLLQVCSYDKLCILLGSLDKDVPGHETTGTTDANDVASMVNELASMMGEGAFRLNAEGPGILYPPLANKRGRQEVAKNERDMWPQSLLKEGDNPGGTVYGNGNGTSALVGGSANLQGSPGAAVLHPGVPRALAARAPYSVTTYASCGWEDQGQVSPAKDSGAGGQVKEEGKPRGVCERALSMVVVSSGSEGGCESASVSGSECSEISDSELPFCWGCSSTSSIATSSKATCWDDVSNESGCIDVGTFTQSVKAATGGEGRGGLCSHRFGFGQEVGAGDGGPLWI